jgi:hypothetical protein
MEELSISKMISKKTLIVQIMARKEEHFNIIVDW